MGNSGATLAIDIGPLTTVAAIERQGRRSPIVFGDSLTLATPSADSDGHTGLVQSVEVVRGDDESVVAVLARHLQVIAGHAGLCDALTVVVPPSWGPRHFDRVSRAASVAELPQPQIISEAAAIAEHCFASAAQDQIVMVCVLGQRTSHATVLQRDSGGWIRVATQQIPDATGDRIDQALVAVLGATDADSDDLRIQIADIRPRLASGQPTAIVVADRPIPVTLRPDDLADAAQAATAAAVAAILDTLDAAAVDPHRLHGAVTVGDLAASVGLNEALSDQLTVPVISAADGRLAAVYGALATRASSSPTIGGGALRRTWGFRAAHLMAPLAAAVAAALLQWQIFDNVAFLLGPEIGRLSSDYEKLPIIFDTAAFACVGWCFLAAALGLARNLAAAMRTSAQAGETSDRQAGQLYAFAAIVGLALASMQGLLAQAIIGGPAELAPPYLAASLVGAVIPALVAIAIGLASRWLIALPAWTDRVHHPITAVILAVTGILAANAKATGLPIPGIPAIVTTILGITGGAMLGVGIAMTLVTMRAARLILGAVLGAACMIIVGVSNLHNAIVLYLVAVALWWIRRGSRLLLDNLSRHWWRRFVPTAEVDNHVS